MKLFAGASLLLLTASLSYAQGPTPPPKFDVGKIQVTAPKKPPDSAALSYPVHGEWNVVNSSGYDVKDVVLSCLLIAPSGTRLPDGERKVTILYNFPSWVPVKTREITMDQAVPQQTDRVNCKVTDAVTTSDYHVPPESTLEYSTWIYPEHTSGDDAESCSACPDYAERFKTFRDLAEPVFSNPRHPAYLAPARREERIPRPFTPRDHW